MEVGQKITWFLRNPEFLESLLLSISEGERGDFLRSVGTYLLGGFQTMASMDDLGKAIIIYKRCLELKGDKHPNYEEILSNLGVALQWWFERTGSMEDLNCTLQKKEQAIESTSVDHPNFAMYFNNLGSALQRQFERTGSIEDLDRAIEKKEESVQSYTVSPSIKLQSAQSCSDILIQHGRYTHPYFILEVAVQLLPRVSLRHLHRSDRQFSICRFANIPSRAVFLSLKNARNPYESLQLLELGRWILATM